MTDQSAVDLECWKCGASLKDVPRPLTRHSLCPTCRVDLHVCRMCRHYAPKYTGQCQHDRADHVTEKERANFCDYFRPRLGAYHQDEDNTTLAAKSALSDLFDNEPKETTNTTRRQRAETETDQARKQLDNLFAGGTQQPEDN